MKQRLKKKIEKNRRRDIHRVLDLVLDINGLEARKQGKTGTLPTAFFEFSGHVALMEARICEKGWESGAECKILCSAYIDERRSVSRAADQLEEYVRKKSFPRKRQLPGKVSRW